MSCLTRKLIFCIFFGGWYTGLLHAQQQTSLEKVRHERIDFNSLQAKRIAAYLKLPDSIRSKTQINHPSFLLTGISKSGMPIYKAVLNAGAAITTDVNLLQDQSLG